MSKISATAGQALLGLALPLVASLAMAQDSSATDLGRVDVSGSAAAKMVKFNVKQACPQIGAELQESLEGLVWRYGEISPMRVDFTLTGNQISEVRTGYSGSGAAIPIKRAVRKLSCDSTVAGAEKYAFIVQFVEAGAERSATAMHKDGMDHQIASVSLVGP